MKSGHVSVRLKGFTGNQPVRFPPEQQVGMSDVAS